ncbi:MAG: hypothetical protein ACYSSI_12365 [Planctomycetota bacterium]|jgi:hypothetical protein
MESIVDIMTDDFVFLTVGILVIIFRKQFAAFIMRYHLKRLQHMKRTKVKLEKYPEKVRSKAESAANLYTEIMIIIIGVGFIIMSMLSILGILKRK